MSRIVIGFFSRLLSVLLFASVVGSVFPASSLNASPVAAAPLPHQQTASRWGLTIRTQTPTMVQWWNHYSTASDAGFSYGGHYASQATAGTRALIYAQAGGSTQTVTQAAIATAKQYGLDTLIYNLEGIPKNHGAGCQVLVDDAALAARLIHQAGMRFVFAPTGWLTYDCYQSYPNIIRNADIFFYQAQSLQGKDPTIVADVQTFVRAAKTIKPGMPVWVQLSVAPSNGPPPTPAQLVSLIGSLESGTPGSGPDQIVVFYATDATPMQQVIQAFRPYHG